MNPNLFVHSSTRAVISLSALRNNLDVVRRHIAKDVKVMSVVKSNAYGHGVIPVVREAVRCGVDYLAVARVAEGLEIRAEGIDCPVLVCELAPQESLEAAIREKLDLSVATVDAARQLDAVAAKMGEKACVHVKVDTGMGRLGFLHNEAAKSIELIAQLRHVEVTGVFSHFATSEENDRTFAREQLHRFESVLEVLKSKKIEVPLQHMANSGAILNLPESHFDMVRPGIALYGYAPQEGMNSAATLRPVMSVLSRVSFLKKVEGGTSISYGRKFFAKTPTTIATVPIGYGDGFSRSLTNRADVLINGKRYPAVGTICMDHLMVDVGENAGVSVGDDVILIGQSGNESITCWDVARTLSTIPYEITCLITPRVPRLYID